MRFNFLYLLIFLISSCTHNPKRNLSSRPETVLHIGDSQSEGYLGRVLHNHYNKEFKKENIRVYGVASSSPRHWANLRNTDFGSWLCQVRTGRFNLKIYKDISKKICDGSFKQSAFEYVNQHKPDVVTFQFLGNSMNRDYAEVRGNVRKLLGQLGREQRCIFITSSPHYVFFKESNKGRVELEREYIKAIGDRCEIAKGMEEKNLERFSTTARNYGKMRKRSLDGKKVEIPGDGKHLSLTGAKTFYGLIKHKLP